MTGEKNMRQSSYIIHRPEDTHDCISQFRAVLTETHKSILITIYTTATDQGFIADLTQRLGEAFPAASILGCMTTDVIRRGEVHEDTTIVSFSLFEKSEVRVLAFDNPDTMAEDGKKFCAEAMRIPHLAAINILGTLRDLDIQPFLDGLAPIDESVVIYGGGANTLESAPPCVITKDKIIEKGLAALLLIGPELHVHASLNFGWKPLGREFTITKMTGVHVLEEIDHQPAAQIYEKYLGILPDEHFSRDTLAFPVFVQRGDSYIARHTVDAREDGALLFIADLHEGETIRLSYGDPREMIEDAKASCADLAEFRPEAISILSCYAHRMFLRDDVKFELSPFRDVAPSHGFYTYGEIYRFAGKVGIHNMMILTVGLREGEKPTEPLPVRGEMPSRLKDSMLLVERLVHFVGATTAELETANRELDHMARTDRLTQIANRGETETVLKRAVAFSHEHQTPLSVLMLDLDDFKKVNDTYGHDIGDLVLTETSKVLRAHVRQGDTVGRWGGEEFLVVLPGADANAAQRIAERIRKNIAALRVLPDGRPFTGSFGIACIAPNEPFEDFYRRVDYALYEAKHGGKNRVLLATVPNNTQYLKDDVFGDF